MTASLLPPTSTNATSWPKPTIVPSMASPFSYCFALAEAANNAAKSSSGCVKTGSPSRRLANHQRLTVEVGRIDVPDRLFPGALPAHEGHLDGHAFKLRETEVQWNR